MSDKEIKEEMRKLGIKRLFNTKQKKAIIAIAIIATAGLISIFVIMENIRSQNTIILATTTSTYDSGLLDYLLPTFEEETGITVDILSVGTGQALSIGESGDADVLLVHARAKEDDFMNHGYGLFRTCIMYNDFIIIGPSSDPANAGSAPNVTEAMKWINMTGQAGGLKFYSRGDESGTYTKELALWAAAVSETPTNVSWYFETGAGMGDTFRIADDNNGYTLIDRGTWLSQKNNYNLVLLVEGDEILLNPYGAMLVNPLIHPAGTINYEKAHQFIEFLVSEQGQTLIKDFRKNDEILFHPDFGNCNETTSCTTTEQEVTYWSQFTDGFVGLSSAPDVSSSNSLLYGTSNI